MSRPGEEASGISILVVLVAGVGCQKARYVGLGLDSRANGIHSLMYELGRLALVGARMTCVLPKWPRGGLRQTF